MVTRELGLVPPKEVLGSIAQLKCVYTNARSMGNKQEELEAIVQQENDDIVAITETWWDDSHNWSAAMGGYKLFRRARQGRRGEFDDGDDRVECLWVRIRGKTNKVDVMVGVCYRPPNQNEEADKIFCKQLGEVSQPLALLLMGDFNLPDVCWKCNTVERNQSRRFLECVEDNFLTQLVSEPTREGTLLELCWLGLNHNRQATQENYSNVMRLCREKIRRAKAELELNLATAIKDNKKYFYKYMSNKRTAEENLHLFLDVEGKHSDKG
ncbi:hypothetical protein QYF61_012495 [Mycteria americana]|uniref:Endonuclease/exonuclease/phosphatase domain-containing protein n=1 Tax=Mycteria americana TaxID=33587 RepID=A0AAN7NS56_MYCAM|nr:hypothetical protein QYF61_012495 [Mycteria americana]